MKTRMKGRWVVGWDEERQSHVVISGGEVVYQGDRIVYVGKHYQGEVDRVVDATSCLITPGLINSHTVMDVSNGLFSFDRPREEGYYRPRSWVEDPARSPAFTPEEVRQQSEFAYLGLAKSGCTTFIGITSMVFKRWSDPEFEPDIWVEI